MAFSFGSSWRSFWHTMTSNDRHASHDSPYKTGQHVPLNSKRHAPLNSISTTAVDSRHDLHSPYNDDPIRRNSGLQGASNGRPASPAVQTPTSPYSPGMRSNSAAIQRTHSMENNPFDSAPQGEIPMQSFQEGLPPPPPVAHSWKRIDRWAENHYEELFDQLSEGATNNDLNELEHELDCSLPMEVRESLQIHDGQERGGRPTGIIFSCMLLDCEEISQEWQNWRTVNAEYLVESPASHPQPPIKAFGGESSSSSSSTTTTQTQNSHWRQDLQSQQDSQPSNAIQKVYAHPNWIPLVRDWGGNNIAVDLAPGPAGKWGQVILFGRDYDCKYVVARSWSAFLAMVADDLSSEKWYVEEDSGDLMLKEFKTNNVEPRYFDILRWRADQKYGRKGPRRKPGGPLTVNSNIRSNGNSGSPYTSPTFEEPGSPRGRSPQRFGSPKPGFGRPSPLSQVSEEGSSALSSRALEKQPFPSSKLVEVATPRPSDEEKPAVLDGVMENVGLDGANDAHPKGLGVDIVNGVQPRKAAVGN